MVNPQDHSVFCGDNVRGKSDVTDFFYDYWLALGADGHLQTRADIRLGDIAQYADRLVLLDIVRGAGGFSLVVRLIATYVTTYYGEISGRDINAMHNERAAKRVYSTVERLLNTGEPLLTQTPAFCPRRPLKEALALYLPLYDKTRQITKVMAALDIRWIESAR
ncbi:MAG: hypothetical protein EP335_07440 [Alphaproteobacteria bacterium]|nr:MAG: hypothetical protein EP335_07440 [Alphaproteobacteria bacterium]